MAGRRASRRDRAVLSRGEASRGGGRRSAPGHAEERRAARPDPARPCPARLGSARLRSALPCLLPAGSARRRGRNSAGGGAGEGRGRCVGKRESDSEHRPPAAPGGAAPASAWPSPSAAERRAARQGLWAGVQGCRQALLFPSAPPGGSAWPHGIACLSAHRLRPVLLASEPALRQSSIGVFGGSHAHINKR